MKHTILIMDDEQSICEAFYFALKPYYEVEYCTDPAEGLRSMREKSFDLLLLDVRLGSRNGIDILRSIQQVGMDTSVIIMTAFGSEEAAMEAMELGAFTYLCKPLDMDELKITIEKVMEFRALRNRSRLSADAVPDGRNISNQIIGNSMAIRQIFQRINVFKDVDSSVLITGESGTGKELVARSLHNQGKRRNGRFVAVNCAAIPEGLLESELFGHKKGAFTGATSDQKGKFLLADHGSIFLDEIGDMPLSLQAKILRVLQEKEIVAVGDTQIQPVNVRVIAATNHNLKDMVEEGLFREDLYYRLNVVEIHIPPLRERVSDIIPLCEFFIQQCNVEQGKNIQHISPTAQKLLLSYSYPGNIRQLANIIEHAVIMTVGDTISELALPAELYSATSTSADTPQLMDSLAGKSLKEIEKMAILSTLSLYKGNKKKAAQSLGISERNLWYKLKEYDTQ